MNASKNASKTYAIVPGWAALLSDLGIDRASLLRRAGLPEDLFAHGPGALAVEEYFRLWAAFEAETGDPALPVRIGQHISVEAFHPPVFAALCSPDLNSAARRIAQHKPLIGPLRLAVHTSSEGLTLEYCWPPGDPKPPAVLMLTELVFWVALARIATRHPIQPLRMVTSVLPAEPADYQVYSGVPLTLGSNQAITFSLEDAGRPFLTANQAMWEFFEPELRKRLAELEAGASMRERVRSALLELLPAGQASIETVAHRLAISPRTLQRRLSAEGATFQDALNQTREALARHYLARSALPTAEIAFLLGYEDPNSFYRAFRDWTGQTPERLRAALL